LPDHTFEDPSTHAHERKSTTSSALEVKVSDASCPIGELAERTGVAPSALRYYDELGGDTKVAKMSA
jgi:hypothetical protein